jgi:hypothetical protein
MLRRTVLAAFLATTVLAAWLLLRRRADEPADLVFPDPRVTFDTPYQNVRPDVQYAGSKTCAGCHEHESESFAQHPMGRSFAALAEVVGQDRYDAAAHNPFDRFGNRFQVERQGKQVVHHVRRPASGSPTLFELAGEAAYVMGSGSHGRAYIVNRDGYLHQSPISWYTQKETWDLSPGYPPEVLFDRPIPGQCLFCHANDARPVAHTVNRYELPLSHEYAIGCERCHGPGELHVASGGKTKFTIVNPAKLAPALRDAVCEQCHLQGEARIVRRGRDLFDFRPGLPLHLFWSVFLRPPELRDSKAVGQVEQMRTSKCFRESDGRLGCISCHDPHVSPKPEEKAAYYRDRCEACHGQPGQTACAVPRAERRKQNDDACHACHMPRLQTADIAHTAMSDHRVRRSSAGDEPAKARRALNPGEVPLVYFHRHLVPEDDDEIRRDLGMALAELAERTPLAAETLTVAAMPLLDKAVRYAPRDVTTREARGYALWRQGRAAKALEDFEAVLEQTPERERSLLAAAYITMALDKLDASADYWRRLLAANPWQADLYADRARLDLRRHDWPAALDAARAGLRINPANVKARQFAIEALLHCGERDEAQREFETLLAVAPPQREEELRRWRDGLKGN